MNRYRVSLFNRTTGERIWMCLVHAADFDEAHTKAFRLIRHELPDLEPSEHDSTFRWATEPVTSLRAPGDH